MVGAAQSASSPSKGLANELIPQCNRFVRVLLKQIHDKIYFSMTKRRFPVCGLSCKLEMPDVLTMMSKRATFPRPIFEERNLIA